MSTKMVYRGTEVDVGNLRRPFSEHSAKLLLKSLKDVEVAMDYAEQTTDTWQQIPRRSMEKRLNTGAVKELLVRTEVDLRTAKRWLVTKNLMATVEEPDRLDIQDPDVLRK